MADINQTAPWVTARLTELGNATNDGLNTLVTSANIGTYDAGNVSGVVTIEHGGTGANNAADAITNLGALTTSDVSTVGKTGEYDDLLNKPTIPTISQTYNASSSDGMSGAAVAQGIAAETERATAAESSLQSAITAEENRAKGAETTLTNNLSTERTQRIQAVQGLVGDLDTANQNIAALQTDLETNTDTLASNFADEYSATSTYSAGDYVIYNNGLYQASQDITTAESWEPGHWTRTTVGSMKEEIEAELAEQTAGSYPTVSVSGSVASFPDGADNIPMKSVIAHIEPVQAGSGDPSPDNVRAISGWTGVDIIKTNKNLCCPADASYSDGVTVTVQSDGGVRIVGTSTAIHGAQLINYFGVDAINLKPGRYKISLTGSGTGFDDLAASSSVAIQLYVDGASVAIAKDSEFTVPESVSYQSYGRLRIAANKTYDCIVYPMVYRIEDGVIDDTYVPPNPTTYPITFDSAGTVYGGYLDVTKGELVVTHNILDLGSKTWAIAGSGGKAYFRCTMTDAVSTVTRGVEDAVCSCYKRFNGTLADFQVGDKIFYLCASNIATTRYLAIRDTDYDDVDSFKTAVTGQTIVYPLATPITYQLTPTQINTLLGQNNIWADTGDIEVEYRADPALYIDGKINATKSLIAGVETEMVATQNYTIGQYIIVGDSLYKVTANIATGTAITVGTNVVATTVAEQLITLANA